MKPDVLRLLQEKNDKIEFEVVITSLCVCVCVCFVVLSFVCVCVCVEGGIVFVLYTQSLFGMVNSIVDLTL
jgi:hypothetical protein